MESEREGKENKEDMNGEKSGNRKERLADKEGKGAC